MGPRFITTTFLNEQEDTEISPENSGESPKSTRISSSTSSSSPKKSKRSIQKRRVISVPIKDVEGYRIKGDVGAPPPSDCWAWRKYGQKPIKGSPYPRGYYRCSSSKGCPARKQVERSNVDAKLLIITYSCDHNHTYPQPTKNNKIVVSATIYEEGEEFEEKPIKIQPITKASSSSEEEEAYSEIDNSNNKLGNFGGGDEEEALIGGGINDYYGLWFSDNFECTSTNSLLVDIPIFTKEERVITDSDMAMAFTNVREEDESFFADLGELPECSAVFRGGGRMVKREEDEYRRHGLSLTPWCGTTT